MTIILFQNKCVRGNFLILLYVFSSVWTLSELKSIGSESMEPPKVNANTETETSIANNQDQTNSSSDFQNQLVFRLPKELSKGDRIEIIGDRIQNPLRLEVCLVTGKNEPDYQNVALQFQAFNTNDHILVNTIESNKSFSKKHTTGSPADYFPGTKFNLAITIDSFENTFLFQIASRDTIIEEVEMKHAINQISYLTFNADIKLDSIKFGFP